MSLVFATNNNHKLAEIIERTKGIVDIKSLSEMGIEEEIPETHETLHENAIEKAMHIYTKYGYDCFADDSGLEIDFLDGKPGVYSARYAGLHCSFEDNIDKVLQEMGSTQHRKARFVTVIAYVNGGNISTFEGSVSGTILRERTGNKGFGYDPVFMPDGYNISFAQMDLETKNKISHRAKAMEKFIEHLKANHQ